MLLIPKSDEIQTAILHASSESQVEPVFWDSEVTVVSSRSKVLGLAECQLVDLGWEAISSFFKSTVLRGAAARNTRVVHFQVGDQSGRPSASSALRLAETWLGEGAGLDAEVTADYHTGVEYEESDVPSPSLAANGDQGEVAQLKERMRALEAELARARQPVIPPGPSTVPLLPGAKHGAEQRLFGTQPASSGLNSEELMKLQQLAGTPPGRLGAAVQRQSLRQQQMYPMLEGLHAEAEKGVIEDPALPGPEWDLEPELVADPIQRMLLLQMKQNSVLMQRMMAPKDPMSTLLSGGGSESGNNSGSARGCMARDMYLRTVQDLPKVGEVARLNAMQELGISMDKEDKDLMHLYIERRVPLAENKMLAHFAVLAAEGWSIAHVAQDPIMKGFIARMLFFIEQSALDNSRLELGWLMSGFPEPNTHLHFSVKRTPGLKPFTRLASPLVGVGESGLPQGPRLHRRQNSDSWKTKRQADQCRLGTRRRAKTQTETKGQEGQEGIREGWGQCRRSCQLRVCAPGEPQSLSECMSQPAALGHCSALDRTEVSFVRHGKTDKRVNSLDYHCASCIPRRAGSDSPALGPVAAPVEFLLPVSLPAVPPRACLSHQPNHVSGLAGLGEHEVISATIGECETSTNTYSSTDLRATQRAKQDSFILPTVNKSSSSPNKPLASSSQTPAASSSVEFFDPYNLMQDFNRDFLSSRTALSQFCRKSLVLQSVSNVQSSAKRTLWPVPLPRWSWTACKHLGPRRRKRKRQLQTRHRAVQLVIACLNWETLGHVSEPPPEACLGHPISNVQHLIIEHIESLVEHHLSADAFTGDDLGRFQEKYQGVIKLLQEVPSCRLAGEDLEQSLIQLHAELDPYSSHFGKRGPYKENESPKSDHQCPVDRSEPLPMSGARPVVSSRIKWQFPPSFEASAFLDDPVVKAAFDDPEVMRKPEQFWESSRPAKINCRSELLDLAQRWDDFGALRLMPADQKQWDEAVGMFAVGKDSQFDRLIINSQNLNGKMWTVSESLKTLAPGCMLGLLHLEPWEAFRFSADDLSDFYYTFRVSENRARRNAFRMKFEPHELEHLKCFKEEHAKHSHLLLCLSTLAMGDNLAVEIAQQAHGNVLKFLCGSMKDEETLKYRHPVPRGSFIELLAIDDHVGLQRLPIKDIPEEPPLRDTEIFQLASKAYRSVGLVQQSKKQKRNCTQGIILGADFDGLKGRVMAPRSRVLLLSAISLAIVSKRTCARRLLNLVVGRWIHVLLFRRVLFSIIDSLFTDGMEKKLDQVFCLKRQSLNELQVLAVLGPTAQCDLRVGYCSDIFCMDASPTGGAVVRAEVGAAVTQEVWRHTEQKGFHTRLQSPVSQILSEHGIEPDSMHMFQDHLKSNGPQVEVPLSLREGFVFDCIEFFRGAGELVSRS